MTRTSKWYAVVQHVILIHPHGPGLQAITHTNRGVEILRVHCSRKTVCGDIPDSDSIRLILELCNRAHGPEDFFLHNPHIFVDVAEDGGLDVVPFPFFALAFAADFDFGAFGFAGLDVARGGGSKY